MSNITPLLIATVAANGVLSGASLDQAIKQLPARHRLGAAAFSAYSAAADLENGLPWYAGLGAETAILSLVTASVGLAGAPHRTRSTAPLALMAALTVAHTAMTDRAAPTNWSQRRVPPGDVAGLEAVFDRFARLNAVRALLQVATLGASAWALWAAIPTRVSEPVGRPEASHDIAATERTDHAGP